MLLLLLLEVPVVAAYIAPATPYAGPPAQVVDSVADHFAAVNDDHLAADSDHFSVAASLLPSLEFPISGPGFQH